MSVKTLMISVTGETKTRNGIAAVRRVCFVDDTGVTRVPGKNVAILLLKNPSTGSLLIDSPSLDQAVSCRNKKQQTRVKPINPTVHQNSKVQLLFELTNALSVGPAMLPKFRHQWNVVNALPRWCRKNRSTSTRGPSTPVTPPKKPAKKRETIKLLNSSRCVIFAAQTWVRRVQMRVQNMVDERPILNDIGAKKKPPVAKPADAALFCHAMFVVVCLYSVDCDLRFS